MEKNKRYLHSELKEENLIELCLCSSKTRNYQIVFSQPNYKFNSNTSNLYANYLKLLMQLVRAAEWFQSRIFSKRKTFIFERIEIIIFCWLRHLWVWPWINLDDNEATKYLLKDGEKSKQNFCNLQNLFLWFSSLCKEIILFLGEKKSKNCF